ncbi:MAG TPA: STAS domain-containing protein [bacterium]|nr:STAS domain-containing protein [bacterium]
MTPVQAGGWVPDDLATKVHKLREMSVVVAYGEVDLTNVHLLKDLLDHLSAREVPLLLDLAKVRYIDSAGLELLMQTYQHCRAQGMPFAVVAEPLVRRTFSVLSLETVLSVFDNAASAREHLVAEWWGRRDSTSTLTEAHVSPS